MNEPPSPTLITSDVVVVGADEQTGIDVDIERWCALAEAVLSTEERLGELTLTFVDRDEIAALNRDHLGGSGPTDVLSFPLDDGTDDVVGVPTLLGDVVICPAVAAEQAATHAGSIDDELALLTVHGVLHVVGHDHAEPADAERMRARELALLERHHWRGPAPADFAQEYRP